MFNVLPVLYLNFFKQGRFANAESTKWGKVVSATLVAVVIAFSSDMSSLADLNKFKAEMRGEFGIGSAA